MIALFERANYTVRLMNRTSIASWNPEDHCSNLVLPPDLISQAPTAEKEPKNLTPLWIVLVNRSDSFLDSISVLIFLLSSIQIEIGIDCSRVDFNLDLHCCSLLSLSSTCASSRNHLICSRRSECFKPIAVKYLCV